MVSAPQGTFLLSQIKKSVRFSMFFRRKSGSSLCDFQVVDWTATFWWRRAPCTTTWPARSARTSARRSTARWPRGRRRSTPWPRSRLYSRRRSSRGRTPRRWVSPQCSCRVTVYLMGQVMATLVTFWIDNCSNFQISYYRCFSKTPVILKLVNQNLQIKPKNVSYRFL